MSESGSESGSGSEGKGKKGGEESTKTIRGLDAELYDNFSKKAREMGMTVGELMNAAMAQLLVSLEAGLTVGQKAADALRSLGAKAKEAESRAFKTAVEAVGDFELVSGVDELTVSRADLLSAKKPLVFANLRRLRFADDVDWELLDSKVRSIKVVDEVIIPKGLPGLQLAKKCQMVKRITVAQAPAPAAPSS